MSNERVSSFQKKGKVVIIPGTRPSVHNSQLLASTGTSSLDSILGGGIPVGSILLIEEDKYNLYSKVLLKYFIADGILYNHHVAIASIDQDPTDFANTLPSPCFDDLHKPKEECQEQMKIAWRYEGQTINEDTLHGGNFSHKFDFTKYMEADMIDKGDISLWTDPNAIISKLNNSSTDFYDYLINNIKLKINNNNLSTSSNRPDSNILRIGINSLGSPLWGLDYTENSWNKLTKFLYSFRAIIRNSFSIAMITIPSHLFENSGFLSRIKLLVDFSVKLESFQGSDKEMNPVFKDYHGLFHVNKLPCLNTLVPNGLDATDWVFRLKKRGIRFEKLHLPPDISEHDVPNYGSNTMSCQGEKLPKNIDF